MGRPIKKKFMGQGDEALPIAAFKITGVAAATAGAYIKAQKGSRRFIISADDDSWKEQMLLVNKEQAGDLADGEFILDAIDEDGNVTQPSKIYNNLSIVDIGGPSKTKWDIGDTTTLTVNYWDGGDTTTLIAFSTNHGLSDGDTIIISGSDGGGVLDGGPYVVTDLSSTEGPDVISIPNPEGVTNTDTGSTAIATTPKRITT